MRKNRGRRYDAATSSRPVAVKTASGHGFFLHMPFPDSHRFPWMSTRPTRRRTYKPEPTGASMSSILKPVQTDETSTLAQQEPLTTAAEQTDGFHLVIDALKANDVDTIYGL